MMMRLGFFTGMALAITLFLSGCVAAIGNRGAQGNGTVGEQLVDLQKAKESGAITEAEFQAEKQKVLGTSSR